MDKIKWIKFSEIKPKMLERVLVAFYGDGLKNYVVTTALYIPPFSLEKNHPKIDCNRLFFRSYLFEEEDKTGISFVKEGFFEELWNPDLKSLVIHDDLSLTGLWGEKIDYWAEIPECNL